METKYKNTLGSERTVEIVFIEEMLRKYYAGDDIVLDVGGIPTTSSQMTDVYNFIKETNIDYRVSDFRGGQYQGDFVQYHFDDEVFDIIIFLSSLEHFPQCTESDVIYREGYDREGYKKALDILNDGGIIFLTVPFGKQRWQPYHQNYNLEGIEKLTEDSKIIESFTYRLIDDEWVLTDPESMEDVIYDDKAHGVGCFVLRKI